MRFRYLLLFLAAGFLAGGADRSPDINFKIHTLDVGSSEPATFADINKDGRLDIVSGENWYEAPTWKKHHFRNLYFNSNYYDDFADLAVDANGDGYPDIVSVGWFGRKLSWWKNPGKGAGDWVEETIDTVGNYEYALLADLDNDGKKQEVLPQNSRGPLSWYEAKDGKWTKHVVCEESHWEGLGVGDVNGDGRNDILTAQGWLEAPPDPRSGDWKFHPDWTERNLGFMQVLDVDGDGKNDIIAGYGHDYGIFWMRQGDGGTWTKYQVDANSWSQAHASLLADLNGDGKKDFVTGKRFMAHNGGDPGEREPLGVYWYEYYKLPPSAGRGPGGAGAASSAGRGGQGAAPAGRGGEGAAAAAAGRGEGAAAGGRAATPPRPGSNTGAPGGPVGWIRHTISYGGQIGGGIQMDAADYDKDGDLDLVCAGKSGLYLFENLTKMPGARSAAAKKTN